MINVIFILAAFTLIALLVLFYVRKKFQIIWNEVWSQNRVMASMQVELVNLNKNLALSTLKNLRLRPLMPSQSGEDLVLAQYFDFKSKGFFVEVGGYDAVDLSNSYFFESIGWDGIIIEPNPDLFKTYNESRPFSTHVNAAISEHAPESTILRIVEGDEALAYSVITELHEARINTLGKPVREIEVPTQTLSEILRDVEVAIDFISIDVEGAELNVLKTLDFKRFRPEVFVIEDNSHGQDLEVNKFLALHGYEHRYRLGCNDFYLQLSNPRSIKLKF